MTQALHIVSKDARRLRWWIAAWVVLLALQTLAATVGQALATRGFAERMLVEQAGGAVSVLTWIMTALVAARLVHGEPLVGFDWFWLTRPYNRWSLFGAKLALALFLLVLLPLAVDVITMAVFHVPAGDMLRAASVFVVRDLRWTLGLLVIAVMTSTLATFALGVIGVAAAFVVVVGGTLATMLLTFEEESAPSALADDPTAALVGSAVFIVAALVVIAYQYHRRRPALAAALAGLGLVAVVGAPAVWPWSLHRPAAPLHQEPFDRNVTIAVDPAVPTALTDEHPFRRRSEPRRAVMTRVVVTGLPGPYGSQTAFTESELAFADGQVLRSRQATNLDVSPADDTAEPGAPLRAALGDVRLITRNIEPPAGPRTALLSISDDQLQRYSTEAGRLTTTVHVVVHHTRASGAVPLAEGSVLTRDGMRLDVLRVQRRGDGCTVLVRVWQVSSLVSTPGHHYFQYALRNAGRREAAAGAVQHTGHSMSPLAFFGWSVESVRGFNVQHVWIDFPQRWHGQADAPRLDPAWLDGAELVVVETVPAGILRRTLTIGEFRLPAL